MSAAAPMSAAQAIGEYLQSPDDLVKISAFRKKLEKEKASIDARLKNGVKEQLQATRDGLRKLLGTRDNVQVIKDEMLAVERACDDPHIKVSTFDQISRVNSQFLNLPPHFTSTNASTGLYGSSKLRVHRRDGQQSPRHGFKAR